MLPADLTRCRVQFDEDNELSYEITMATFEFVDFLFDVIVALRQSTPAGLCSGLLSEAAATGRLAPDHGQT